MADEEPVPFPDAARPDRVLHKIRIDLVPTVFEIPHQRLPLAQSVPDRHLHRTRKRYGVPNQTGFRELNA